jgi:uncharacterized membrane protein YeaQ/YmgE (transglycosylase-associated protein family)
MHSGDGGLLMTILGFILFLLVALLCAWVADSLLPGNMPGGFWGAALIGLIGAWLGDSMLGRWGPNIGGVFPVQTIIGAGILVFLLSLYSRNLARR